MLGERPEQENKRIKEYKGRSHIQTLCTNTFPHIQHPLSSAISPYKTMFCELYTLYQHNIQIEYAGLTNSDFRYGFWSVSAEL